MPPQKKDLAKELNSPKLAGGLALETGKDLFDIGSMRRFPSENRAFFNCLLKP